MKIELKNTQFKILFEYLNDILFDSEEMRDVIDELRLQYNKAFLKHTDEKQEFELNEKVKFKFGKSWITGIIYKVFRCANGQYKYVIKLNKNFGVSYTSPLTKKNIRKV